MYGTHTLAFQRIFVRIKIISLIFIRFSYVSLIRNGVTGPLHPRVINNSDVTIAVRVAEGCGSCVLSVRLMAAHGAVCSCFALLIHVPLLVCS
jgi:hypothetical protein